ncbi:MAG: hypothetical protein ACREM3_25615, partial [Candidatus Rokuibacteriota bacterium]
MEDSFFAGAGIPRVAAVPPAARHAPWLGFTGTHAPPSEVGRAGRSARIEEGRPGEDADGGAEPPPTALAGAARTFA